MLLPCPVKPMSSGRGIPPQHEGRVRLLGSGSQWASLPACRSDSIKRSIALNRQVVRLAQDVIGY